MSKKSDNDKLNSVEGWDIYNFNHNKRMPAGAKGFGDYVCLNKHKGRIIFIEAKHGSDTLKEKQKKFREICLELSKVNSYFKYMNLKDDNIDDIIEDMNK